MGLLDSPIAFLKWVLRAFITLIKSPVLVPIRVYQGVKGARSWSPATHALTAVAVLLAGVTGAGFFFATQATTDVSASSAPVLSALLEWTTNGWGYVIAAIVFGRGTVWGLRRARINRAARETGYSAVTIARLADEIRTTDGTGRAIIFGDDSLAEATDRVLNAFEGEDDRLYHDTTGPVHDHVVDAVAAGESLAKTLEKEGFSPTPHTRNRTLRIPDKDTEDETSNPDEQIDASRPERFKLWRMDLATGLQTGDIVWKLLVPTAIVFVLELILVQFWVRWWLYPSMLAGAFLAGLTVYRVDAWRRKRRLESLRQDRGGETWEEIGVLVKTVETDEMTVHMGFLAGRQYASTDRQDLAETLASRALERSHGYHPSPAIEERYAWCLDRYIVNFAGWRENMEKPRVMDQLVNEVLDAEEGILPKDVLAERVVEHDRRYIWQGLRFVGMGYDPDLVAECYEELVPNTLVEHDLDIRAPGGEREVTAVRARTETLPPDVATLRANFSDRFPVRALDRRYNLPDVEPDEATRGFAIPS